MMLEKLKHLNNHQGFIRYFKNTGWMIAEQFLRIIAGLFVGIWVARFLGPEQFGIFSYVLAFTAICGGIAKLGLDRIMVREFVNHPEKCEIYLATAFWLKVMGALMVMGLMAAIVPFTNSDRQSIQFIFIIAAGLVFQSFEVVEFYFQSQVMAKVVSICKAVQLSLSSVLKIYLVITQSELLYFVLVAAFDTLSLAMSYFIAYLLRKDYRTIYKHFDLSIAKRLLNDSWPLIFTGIVVSIYMRIDQVMIKEMLGEYEIGIYSAAVRLSESIYFIPVLISASIFPAILNSKKYSEELYKQRLQRLYAVMVWMAITLALLITILSDWLVLLLFGQPYQESGQILIIHVWSAVFVFLGVSFGNFLLAENLAKIDFQRTFVGAVCNVLLNIWLIPIYGASGAAIATLLAQCVANFGYDCFDRRLHQQLKMKIRAFTIPLEVFKF